MTQNTEFVGIDVGKNSLFAFSSLLGAAGPFANDGDGFAKLIDWLRQSKSKQIIAFEPTGGHEWVLWQTLSEAGFEARQVSASHVRSFARACGRLAKTDTCDARMIAGFIAFRPKAGKSPACKKIREINNLTQKRRQLVAHRKSLKCQINSEQSRGLAAEFQNMNEDLLAHLSKHIKSLETQIAKAIEAEPQMQQRAQILRSIPGVGPVLAAVLLTQMPELGKCGDRQIAALAGVAPMDRQSGEKDHYRRIFGGRADVRAVLYQAALVATIHNKRLSGFANRLRADGKPHKVVLIAVARKLLIYANQLVAKNTMWAET